MHPILNSTNKSNNNKTDNTSTTNKPDYVEILTIEPNTNNTTQHNIIEVLKHLMPKLNNSNNKELHSVTIIERNHSKNHSISETKNISTLVLKYCDKGNITSANITDDKKTKLTDEDETGADYANKELPVVDQDTIEDDYDIDKENSEFNDKEVASGNSSLNKNKDVLEAAEYGMQKMHELYSVLEPKLYSMGLWLDDTNPARYVAAFNAPSEESARYSRYGYATLQAATKLKQLNRGDADSDGDNSAGAESRTEAGMFPAASALRQSALLDQCPLRTVPKCPPASKRYRTHDGTCNNLSRPRWGSTMTPVQRFLQPSYSDGIQAPRRSVFGSKLPSAREISSLVHEDQNVENHGITHLLMQWGQFLDHDVTSSSQSRGFNGSVPRCCKDGGRDFMPKELMHPECLPIAVPPSDPFYGPRGVRCLDFVRSSPAPRDDCALGWRDQLNQVSAYIDGSPLYASSARKSDKLRLFRNGMLQYGRVQQRRPVLPPERRDELCRGGAVSSDCFRSGDARVNEHPGLVAAHIVWLRQHNRMAQELAHLNPHWSDEKIYQETRKIIGAMLQHITYREFLPVVLGSEVMRLFELDLMKKGYFKDYNPKINPNPASSFGSAAFRFGHSLVQPSMVRFDRFHRPMGNNVSLHNEITNPSNIWSMGAVDRLLIGMINQPIQKRDEFITEELTNHLFQTPHFDFGMDLAAINIQRGRDHGVPAYTSWREPCGLSTITDFEDLARVMPKRVVRKLKNLYRHVDDIDLFTGGMAERPVIGGLVGPTFACIIAQQFSNLRKGDRFWYENGGFESSFTPAQLQQIRRISLAQILCRTLDTIDSIQPFAFLSPDNPDNERISCQNGLLNNFDLSPWIEVSSDSNNDIKKSDNDPSSTLKPNTKPTTTTRPITTKKSQKLTSTINKTPQNRPVNQTTRPHKVSHKLNGTDLTNNDTDKPTASTTTKPKTTVQTLTIDDKLDFKNKSSRYSDFESIITRHRAPTRYYNNYNDYDDNVQSVQSLLVNNLQQKRPYNRPVITVTENVDKYTYLINYVPRPTQSWRQTTRKTHDRDVVKVTYQSYDDTYDRRPNRPYYYDSRRPNKPYYNRHDSEDDIDSYRRDSSDTQLTYNFNSTARSTDKDLNKTKLNTTTDKNDKIDTTTENQYKLTTFSYVGTYRGDNADKTTKPDKTDAVDQKNDKYDSMSKDFTTFEAKDKDQERGPDHMTNADKISTFYLYETATKPYNLNRPTRRNDEENIDLRNKNKYYYVRNVLHKYPDTDSNLAKRNTATNDGIVKKNYNHPGVSNTGIEERSAADKVSSLAATEPKAMHSEKSKIKAPKPSSSPKTPSVAFQVIPSENSPSQWAVYEENADLPEGLPQRMPSLKIDPHALREIPRPINLSRPVRRRPEGRL
ncbi:uncharacterized protein LOC106718259 [Papilio machaon]|uniref:uncharacterized protein LOC106718259 n=1 Tax=Papilio machaon TaxID=76193 RepID=UPI001E6658B4|nr:uncharacterized protein LOC106718259 [Papilio machaon]